MRFMGFVGINPSSLKAILLLIVVLTVGCGYDVDATGSHYCEPGVEYYDIMEGRCKLYKQEGDECFELLGDKCAPGLSCLKKPGTKFPERKFTCQKSGIQMSQEMATNCKVIPLKSQGGLNYTVTSQPITNTIDDIVPVYQGEKILSETRDASGFRISVTYSSETDSIGLQCSAYDSNGKRVFIWGINFANVVPVLIRPSALTFTNPDTGQVVQLYSNHVGQPTKPLINDKSEELWIISLKK